MTYPLIDITQKERDLCVFAKTFEEFKNGYSSVVPAGVKPIDVYTRAAAIWRHRRTYVAREKKATLDPQVLKRDCQGKFASVKTEQALLIDILNEIRLVRSQIGELGNLKDTLVAVRDIHDIMVRLAQMNREKQEGKP